MSNKPHYSAHIAPPNNYTPGSSQQSRKSDTKYRHRGRAGGGRGGYRDYDNKSSNYHGNKDNDSTEQNDDNHNKIKNQPRDRFHRNEDDDYFAGVEEYENYQVEPEDTSLNQDECSNQDPKDDEEDDPLDAYMKSLEGETDKRTQKSLETHNDQSSKDSHSNPELSPGGEQEPIIIKKSTSDSEKKAIRLDIDETDDVEESYYKYVEQFKGKSLSDANDLTGEDIEEKHNLVEYDKDGNILIVKRVKREIEPLPAIDHSTIKYENFHKCFYKEHKEIERLTPEQIEKLRSKLEIKVSGNYPPKPVCSFAHFNFDEQLMKVIRRSEYTQPTPIQAQAIPAALLGRNIIGIAMTGSGKTAAYLWPMIVHIMGQADLRRGDGPIGLVLVPTRELALQVYGEAKKFSKAYNMAVVCAYGGGSKYEQSQDLEAGAEMVVATPGRLIDLIKSNATNLRRVTYVVLDEADRFFEMGFEAQVRSICDHIRPDRQTLLFSATFKFKIEQLARSVTDDPIKIVQKALGEANEDVTQHVIVFSNDSKKWEWLLTKLVEFTSSGSVLIFVTRIVNAEELNKNLNQAGKETLLLHGDMEQAERNRVITLFKKKEKEIMIATDVAARGLDITHIKTVINYDVARDIDTHIHRVGRTGRAGTKGDAYTLVSSEKDKEFSGHLVKNLESSNQIVPEDLMKLAMQSRSFRKLRGGSDRDGSRQEKNNRYSHHNSNRTSYSRHHHHHQSDHDRYRHGSHQHGKDQRYQNRSHGDDRDHQSSDNHHNTMHQHYHSSRDGRAPSTSSSAMDRSHNDNDYRKRARWNS